MQISAVANLGVNVRRVRQGAGLTIDRLAAKSGVSARTIVNIESGASSPRLDVVARIADGLGVSVVDLLAQESAK